jgi:uncharacterized protein YyaL (SSP411 family)
MAATALARLGILTGESRWTDIARRTLESVKTLLEQYPTAAGQSLIALDFLLCSPEEFAVAGGEDRREFDQALEMLYTDFLPHRVVAAVAGRAERAQIPLLSERESRAGIVTTYLCRNNTCEAPFVGVEEVQSRLTRLKNKVLTL